MNYEHVYNTIVNKTVEYVTQHNIKSMILGISGGLDSTVVAAIGYAVNCKTAINLIGVMLPSDTNEQEENDSASKTAEAFCNTSVKFNISKAYNDIYECCDLINDGASTNISKGNIKARLRMLFLYDLASTYKGIVLDTDNLTENNLGFFTIHGDVGDFNPIGGLWKTEVYELAKWIRDNKAKNDDQRKALELAINITPTDGNGVKSGGDLAQISPGFTYDEVDTLLKAYTSKQSFSDEEYEQLVNEVFNGDMGTADKIIQRHQNSAFKRKKLPIKIGREYLIEYNDNEQTDFLFGYDYNTR